MVIPGLKKWIERCLLPWDFVGKQRACDGDFQCPGSVIVARRETLLFFIAPITDALQQLLHALQIQFWIWRFCLELKGLGERWVRAAVTWPASSEPTTTSARCHHQLVTCPAPSLWHTHLLSELHDFTLTRNSSVWGLCKGRDDSSYFWPHFLRLYLLSRISCLCCLPGKC